MRSVIVAASVSFIAVLVPATALGGPFQSPSKNIGCYIGPNTGVRCDIGHRTWSPRPKPANCDLDYGQGVYVGKGRAGYVCAGDTALGAGKVLKYGKTIHEGVYSCTSMTSGMKCANNHTHHGFVLSVQSVRFF
jgi:hypothetical protein